MLPHDELGSGPAIVLLHAGIADRTMWTEHLEPLAAAGYRAIALDLPGFGEAPIAPGEQAPWTDVLRAMDELGLDRAAVVGNSFGGAVALRIAVVAPERVSELALISAPAPDLEPSSELEAAWHGEEEALERGDVDAAVDAVVRAWTLPDAPDELRSRVGAMQRRAFLLQRGAGDVNEAPDPLEENPEVLATIEIPTLVTVGEVEFVDFETGAQRLAHAIPRSRHEVIAGAGHLAPLETPERFRDMLLAFLAAAGSPAGRKTGMLDPWALLGGLVGVVGDR
ncbi:MAG TPA: alpha/beta hydrolase [Candidatus Dormibacteraeota bacterium]|nr:alpha/beta hydrolase [Candidatus Dormibacteraeota bacterium]